MPMANSISPCISLKVATRAPHRPPLRRAILPRAPAREKASATANSLSSSRAIPTREILSRTVLTGKCYGSPVGFNGKIYIQTEKKLYCFGKKGSNLANIPAVEPEKWPAAGRSQKAPGHSRGNPF